MELSESALAEQSLLQSLPLRCATPAAWARAALKDPDALLNDHAHLEKKAASNALELLCRWPDAQPPSGWLRALTSIAAEEAEHLRIVSGLLLQRGHPMARHHRNEYAGKLHSSIRRGEGRKELADRLYVAGLIEARSCERFILLAREAQDELADLYRDFLGSEVGHFHAFFRMARQIHEDRTDEWLDLEAAVVSELDFFPGILSGFRGL